MEREYVAHFREVDRKIQTVSEHLQATANLAARNAVPIGLSSSAELVGLLHDLGKWTDLFNRYIQSNVGMLKQGDDGFIRFHENSTKIDHASAGAQYIYDRAELVGLIRSALALVVKSHHGGLIDCLTPDGRNNLDVRMHKDAKETRLNEALANCSPGIITRIDYLIRQELLPEWEDKVKQIESFGNNQVSLFALGMTCRSLFSCLIDADRQDTADFETPDNVLKRQHNEYIGWDMLAERLEQHLDRFVVRNHIDEIRNKISIKCLEFASKPTDIYSLTVPTGGGKTLASLRFALHHAKKENKKRIIFIVPFTTIIDQNAQTVREILEKDEEPGTVVLEHHSNLTKENETEQTKLLSENWDSPIIFTTMVQFLEAMFSGGTRGVRRMHTLANSIVIFDEIQSLSIRLVHLFNLGIRYLKDCCKATILLCTATQPLLDEVDQPYALPMTKGQAIISDPDRLHRDLARTEVQDLTKPGGWTEEETAEKVLELNRSGKSVLVVVNTKNTAALITRLIRAQDVECYHLSTSMCPAHRCEVLSEMNHKLDRNKISGSPVAAVSTQLIEAGVNVDFDVVIRFASGLDSIVQAAGRCNRNGLMQGKGQVFIVNSRNENISKLEEIKEGKRILERILGEFELDPGNFNHDLLSPSALKYYYQLYFFEQKNKMSYNVRLQNYGISTTLIDLLSVNKKALAAGGGSGAPIPVLLRQSFQTAGEHFHALDSYTQGVIVPFGKGQELINALCSAYSDHEKMKFIKEAQRYSVNLFTSQINELIAKQAVAETQKGSGVYYLQKHYYDKVFGLCKSPNLLEFYDI